MRGALNQAGAAVQKLVGLPFQGNTAMWAAISVDEHLTLPAYCQKCVAFQVKTSAL